MRELELKSVEDARAKWRLIGDIVKEGLEGGKLLVIFQRPRRNNLTNSKMHAMISDIHQQAVITIPGKRVVMSGYLFDECKALLCVWFQNEMILAGTPLSRPGKRIIDPFTGECITIRPSTREFSQSEACAFIEFLYATGTDAGVKWTEPAMQVYEEYARREVAA